MKKVIVRIFGGLGNQLFCYSAARRLALVNEAELVIDHVSGFVRDKYNRHYELDAFSIPCRKATPFERLEPFSRIRRKIWRTTNKRLPFDKRTFIFQERNDFDSRLLKYRMTGNVYLEGYWQSEQYFKDIESTIRSDLSMPALFDKHVQDMGKHIKDSQSVAVHFRFFDALSQTGINNAPVDYYLRAINRMEEAVPDAHYYIFSDQPELARNSFPMSDNRITTVSDRIGDAGALADFWLMTKCKNFITANSTFSWWAGWLGCQESTVIIAPNFNIGGHEFITSWGFDGLIPDDWIALE